MPDTLQRELQQRRGNQACLCGEGFSSLLPAHTLNAFEALPRVRWKFCWACYQHPPEQRPIADAASPVMARFDTPRKRA